MRAVKVRDVMTHLVATLRPNDPIPRAAQEFLVNRISGCPVVEQGKLVGVVTEADLVGAHSAKVADVMTTGVITVAPDAGVWEAARLIDRFGVRRLPVVDAENFVIGIVARSDIIRAMALSDEDIESSVKELIAILGEENFDPLTVHVHDGVVTLDGTADRRTTKRLAVKLAAHANGVLEIRDQLGWRLDDTHPSSGPHLEDFGPYPKAVGPLAG